MVFRRNRSDVYSLSEIRTASKQDLINIAKYHYGMKISTLMLKKYYYDLVVKKLKQLGKIKSISKKRSRTKSIRRKSKSIGRTTCREITNISKYVSRPGPPYKAQDCKNIVTEGNNGKMYISLPNKNGIYRWILT